MNTNTSQLSSPTLDFEVNFDVMSSVNNLVSGLDDESRDQIGTFLLAVFVGALATFCRWSVQRKHRWWLNMILVHGAIFAYWWNQCHLDTSESAWFKTAHGALCWRDSQGNFQRIYKWGGETERMWVNVLVWLAIFANVLPAYATGNEANRHMTHVKKRACNPLINHIIAGILCVIFPYFVITWRLNILIPVAVILDIYHQITIHRLIANHDGIWVLRAVSMSLAICKWIAILNLYSAEPTEMLDQIFIMSTGFLGTRCYGALAFLAYYLGLGDIKTAQWYSIGLMTANIAIQGRLWGQMRIGFWLTVVNCAAMNYHQMWKKWIHLRPHFVGMCCVLAMSVAHSGLVSSLMFTIVFAIGNFILPHFNRFRPAPPKGQICTPAVSTRAAELFTRSARQLAHISKRIAGFNTAEGLSNSLLSVRSALMTPQSSRSALMTPTPRITRQQSKRKAFVLRQASVASIAESLVAISEGTEDKSEQSSPKKVRFEDRTGCRPSVPAPSKLKSSLVEDVKPLSRKATPFAFNRMSSIDTEFQEASQTPIPESLKPAPIITGDFTFSARVMPALGEFGPINTGRDSLEEVCNLGEE